MRAIVMTLIGFCAALIISGCGTKVVAVPSGCDVMIVDDPILDTRDRNTTLGEAKRCAENYMRYKEAFEKQRKAAEACRK